VATRGVFWHYATQKRCVFGTYFSLLLVNRQIYNEVHGLLFKHNRL